MTINYGPTKEAYVITKGLETGVFCSWSETKPLVNGVSGARYKGYETLEEAIDAWDKHIEQKELMEEKRARQLEELNNSDLDF